MREIIMQKGPLRLPSSCFCKRDLYDVSTRNLNEASELRGQEGPSLGRIEDRPVSGTALIVLYSSTDMTLAA